MVLCERLLAHGVPSLAISSDLWSGMLWFDYLNLRLNGPEFHGALQPGQARFDDPRVRLVFETWGSLFKRGCFGSAGGSQTTWQSLAPLNPGANSEIKPQPVAMTLAESRDMAWFPESFLTEVDFFPFPRIDPKLPAAEIIWPYGYMVPAEAENVVSALTFLTYMSAVEAQTALGVGFGPTIAPINPNIEPALLYPGQRQGRSLLYEAETIVLDRRGAMTPLMVDRFASAYGRFWRDPDNLEAVLAEWPAE